jgi:hypothetical protein
MTEVLFQNGTGPFHKVITDAKKRNKILFDKLGII